MFQDTDTFSGIGIGIAAGTQPISQAPPLDPGIHLRWGGMPVRGLPPYGYYLLRRKSSWKGVRWDTPEGSDLVETIDTNRFGHPTPPTSDWVHIEFVDRRFINRVDVSFASGDSDVVTVTAYTDGVVGASETIGPGPIDYPTVTVTGEYITSLRLEGDLRFVRHLRFFSLLEDLTTGWEFVPGADKPLSVPLAHQDYPTPTAPSTIDEARSMAGDRIRFGPPERYVRARTDDTEQGTVTVSPGTPIVVGVGTRWTDDRAGHLLRVGSDTDVYTVLTVLSEDRLLLSRPYTGPSASGQTYSLEPDRFGSIHDALATLFTDGLSSGGMSARALPQTIQEGGTVTRNRGDSMITGQGTAWDTSIEGLGLQVALPTTGTAIPVFGETSVQGVGTNWDERLTDAVFIIDGQLTRYTVASVSGPTALELDRPYVGRGYPDWDQAYTIYERAVSRIGRVLGPTELELDRPHDGPTHDSGRSSRIVGLLTGDDGTGDGPSITLSAQYPLETLLLASIDPAVSQLLGTYWVDTTVQTDTAYDYLIVADYSGDVWFTGSRGGVFESDDQNLMNQFVSWLVDRAERDLLDAFLVPELVRGTADPPSPTEPRDVRVYDLPELPSSGADGGRHAAGVRWNRPRVQGRLPVDTPTLHYLWRHPLHDDPGSTPPAASAYDPIGRADPVTDLLEEADPFLVTADGNRDSAVPGWPAESVFAVDGQRPAGWYSYRVSGMDLFGRHTALSDPGTWYDRETTTQAVHGPFPDAPDFAVELRSRLPPPPPTGVTAAVLDPQDPADADDPAAVAWWNANGSRVALRIRWAWPATFAEQAPETDAFECYFQPGSLNSHAGTVTAVSEGADTTRITTSLSHTVDPTDATTDPLLPGAFAGGALQLVGARYTVVDSGDAGGLWVDVLNREGPDGPVVPTTGADCSLAVPAVFSRGTAVVVDGDTLVTGENTGWREAHEGRPFRLTTTNETYTVATVESPSRIRLDRPYAAPPNRTDRDPDATGGPSLEATAYAIDHPASTDYSEARAWAVAVDDVAIDADLQNRRTPEGDRFYETIVPAPGADGGAFDPGVGPGESPVVHANVGVCARIDTPEETLRGDIGGPAPVARPHRDRPRPPEIPPLPSTVDWATRPDYDGQSHYTIRWEQPPAGEAVHVYRAMDRTLFRVDWERRQTSGAYVLDADDLQYFPPDVRGGEPAERQRRDEIAATLTTGLDVDTFADAEAVYTRLAPDELHTLAALPGTEPAFTQLTTEPLPATDAPNVRGPDFESGDPGPGSQSGSGLCAYVDSFDGRSRNRYLYRVGSVDEAHNRSETLSFPTPPTQARDGVPPEKPVVTSILAGHADETEPGDRQITLRWNVVRSPDLVRYRVFRTDDPDATRDVRLMDETTTLSVPIPEDGDPLVTGRRENATIVWTDDDRDAGQVWHYRVVAEDDAGNASTPSTSVGSRAFDTTPPTPPALTAVEWVRVGPEGTVQPYDDPVPTGESWPPAIRVVWDDPGELRVLVEASEGVQESFLSVSQWVTEERELVHRGPLTSEPYQYRLIVLDSRGTRVTGAPTAVPTPGGGS